MHNLLAQSGLYYFEGCNFSLKTYLNIVYFKFMLHGHKDAGLYDLLEFGFPLGYFGDIQRQKPDFLRWFKITVELKGFQCKFKNIRVKKNLTMLFLDLFQSVLLIVKKSCPPPPP